MKYVLVTGGVVSGLGKGVTASSIGVLLKACGHRVTSIKIGASVEMNNGYSFLFHHLTPEIIEFLSCRPLSQRGCWNDVTI